VEVATKVFRAQAEYWHAAHLAEQLIELAGLLHARPTKNLRQSAAKSAKDQMGNQSREYRQLIRALVQDFSNARPDKGYSDPVIEDVNSSFETLLNECDGDTLEQVSRKVDWRLLECIGVIQSWIVDLATQIETVARQPAFAWIELAATLSDENVPLDGVDGRHPRLQRIVRMLDSVVAIGSWEERVLDADSVGQCLGPDGRVNPYAVICKLQEQEQPLAEPAGVSESADLPKAEKRSPMTKGQKDAWDVLSGRILSASAMVIALDDRGTITSEGTIRQHIRNLRKSGYVVEQKRGRGYYRSDDPPPELALTTS
jgi:hypothetical protein